MPEDTATPMPGCFWRRSAMRRPIRPVSANPAPRRRHRARLLRTASRFIRVFELAAPDAPGLVAFGAEFDPAMADPLHAGSPAVSVSGVGLTLQEAFQGCIGEGIEYLSQLQTGTDVLIVRCRRSGGRARSADAGVPRRSRGLPPAPAMPSFHGTAPRGLPMVARSCCRRICACAGRRGSKRSRRRSR